MKHLIEQIARETERQFKISSLFAQFTNTQERKEDEPMPRDTSSPATQRITYGDSRMKRLRYHLSAAAAAIVLALLALSPPVYAGGMWEQLPQSGVAVCSNTINGVCTATTAAAPSITGNETVPADTNLSGGRNPQSARYSFVQMGMGATTYVAPLTGTSITLTNNIGTLIIDPAGTIATYGVTFPAASTLVDGQNFRLCATQIITALTITDGAGATVQGKLTATVVPVTTGAASCAEWTYVAAQTKWFRVQ